MEEVITEVSDKILERLKEQIEEDVFTTPNEWYENTGEFEQAWQWGDVKANVLTISRELAYDPSSMQWNRHKWQHGNRVQSSVESLADILNLAYNNYTAGYTSSLMFGNRHFSHFRRPYFKNFITNMFDNGEIRDMLTNAFSKHGVILVS